MQVRIEMSDTSRLFKQLKMKNPTVSAGVKSDSPYMNRLDHGWSQQAPSGILGPTRHEVELAVEREMRECADQIARGSDPTRAFEGAMTDAAHATLAIVVPATPIDTGAARMSWEVEEASGNTFGFFDLFPRLDG